MCSDRLIVLKFGGSVLKDGATLRLAVHEIYRWRRQGWRVLAVVSALAGRTDALLRLAGAPLDEDGVAPTCGTDPHAVAALLATGEHHSAGLLGLHLDRAGMRTAVLWPSTLGLIAHGPALDATPAAVDVPMLRAALDRHGVVVVPGYAAVDREGRPVVLGRGGSDLTALFLAHALKAQRCRLIKDVDGLYDRDPARPGPRARRFAAATCADALATDGSIVQHKAVRFAREHGLQFELGRLNSRRPSRIGAPAAAFTSAERPRRLRVALLGLGTVGAGVHELLTQMQDQVEIAAVAVRDPTRPRSGLRYPLELTGDAVAAAGCGADVVIEAIGGCVPALAAAEAALRSGAHFITANKKLIAEHGPWLASLARSRNLRVRYSAAVGGSMPILERIESLGAASIRSVRAVINGTTNFVLDRVADGMDFDEAVRLAQQQGYAEQDPSRDLLAHDAADKLCLLARHLGHADFSPDQVRRDELTASSLAKARLRRSEYGGPLRHVAMLERRNGGVQAQVRLLQVGLEDPLASARDAGNVAVLGLSDGSQEILEGKGAGRWPTAEAVVADLLEIARSMVDRFQAPKPRLGMPAGPAGLDEPDPGPDVPELAVAATG